MLELTIRTKIWEQDLICVDIFEEKLFSLITTVNRFVYEEENDNILKTHD